MSHDTSAEPSRSRSVRLAIHALVALVALGVGTLLVRPVGTVGADPDEAARLAVRLQELFSALARQIQPAVVSIGSSEFVPGTGTSKEMFDRLFRGDSSGQRQQSLGSGVIIDRRGYILTNSHVVVSNRELRVRLWDNREVPAVLIEKEDEIDIALVKIDLPGLSALPMGDSDQLEVGHMILAVGNPFGFTQTVSSGIVSAVGRSDVGLLPYESFIQTDASINQGNSGGPLVNLQGEVVGINTAIFSGVSGGNVGIGFAIPINLAKALVSRWIEGKQPSFLGVETEDLDEDMVHYLGLPSSRGAFVQRVHAGSPAARAGLAPKDVVLSLGGIEVRNVAHLKVIVTRSENGVPIPIEVRRQDRTLVLQVTLTEKSDREIVLPASYDPTDEDAVPTRRLLGISVSPVNPQTAALFNIPTDSRGILVIDVEAGSAAATKKIRPGDLIVEVNEKRVGNMEDFWNAMKGSPQGAMMKIQNLRGETRYLFFRR